MPGYSATNVSYAIILNKSGDLVDIQPLFRQIGKKSIPIEMMVPERVKRTVGISANLLCDNSGYVLGLSKVKKDKNEKEIIITQEKYIAFKTSNLKLLEGVHGYHAESFVKFLCKWDPVAGINHSVINKYVDELTDGGSIVFKLDGDTVFLHNDKEVCRAWERYYSSVEPEWISQCLVTGEKSSIAKLHPSIKKVVGANATGASLVSFNIPSFLSYNKEQSFNSPVSKRAAFAYGTSLNYLLSSDFNRIRIADTTMVFWADRLGAKKEEQVFFWSLNPTEPTEKGSLEWRLDPNAATQAKSVLSRVKNGLKPGNDEFDPNVRCYILGLSPNSARLSVRFWQVNLFGGLLENISQHYRDLDVVGMDRIGTFVSPYRILKSVSVQESSDNIPPLIGGQLMKSILSGRLYPQTLYNAAIARCRTGGEYGGVNTIRAGVIKACLIRKFKLNQNKEKEEMLTMGLNELNTNQGYLLGRLFSMLEKAQRDALGNQVNATIRDRYFGAASATPGSVFPILLRLSQHHLAKAEYGNIMNANIQKVLNLLDNFPNHLNLDDQGQFFLGYYHQNQANYQKKEKNDVKEG